MNLDTLRNVIYSKVGLNDKLGLKIWGKSMICDPLFHLYKEGDINELSKVIDKHLRESNK